MFENKNIFFDFDGVIKESVGLKTQAFIRLFESYGPDIEIKIANHNKENGGMSRYNKIPIYLEWAGQKPTKALVDSYAHDFSKLVKKSVIDSEWVPGVIDFLENKKKNQLFFIVTATPQTEIEEIISFIRIENYFNEVIGTPTKKNEAIKLLLSKYTLKPTDAIMIGDSIADYESALSNSVPFILRRTYDNIDLQKRLDCSKIYNFLI
tara:strand:+ start:3383 stop:4006 length:624 start_codon:yes stop_codon:yes gene_type:complete